jgi:translation initiation factor IF-3
MAHKEIGEDQCRVMAERLVDVAVVEQPPRMDGRQMVMMIAPKRK